METMEDLVCVENYCSEKESWLQEFVVKNRVKSLTCEDCSEQIVHVCCGGDRVRGRKGSRRSGQDQESVVSVSVSSKSERSLPQLTWDAVRSLSRKLLDKGKEIASSNICATVTVLVVLIKGVPWFSGRGGNGNSLASKDAGQAAVHPTFVGSGISETTDPTQTSYGICSYLFLTLIFSLAGAGAALRHIFNRRKLKEVRKKSGPGRFLLTAAFSFVILYTLFGTGFCGIFDASPFAAYATEAKVEVSDRSRKALSLFGAKKFPLSLWTWTGIMLITAIIYTSDL